MVGINPRKIPGAWRDGYALDLHTLSSVYAGDDEFGHPKYDTTRSAIGELLYKLKNRDDISVLPEILSAAKQFLGSWRPKVDVLIPVPPSTKRQRQPVIVIAEGLAREIGVPCAQCISLTRDTAPLKNVSDYNERMRLLDGLFSLEKGAVEGKSVLLVDDLFRSGATMNAVSRMLYDLGKAKDVFALTITQTRVNR
ncbi:MAG TPA: ComF family protein [Alphaproteobacteria bacterium]|nr:ComF family protein [Alphaproteobacteria bacterium]